MKTYKIIVIFFLLSIPRVIYAQTEWSTPQRLDGEFKFKSARSPSISSDDSTLYIETSGHVYYSTITDTGWTWPERLDAPFNHPDFLIINSYLASNDSMLIYSRWNGSKGWNLYYAVLTETGWSDELNFIGPINTIEHEWYGSMNPGMDTLFVSRWDFSQAALDLNMHVWEDSAWGEEYRLPYGFDSLNWFFNDDAIFMTRDGKELYISSDRGKRPDLFVAKRRSGGGWGAVERLTISFEPDTTDLNKPTAWDMTPYLSADGQTLYYTSSGSSATESTRNSIWFSTRVLETAIKYESDVLPKSTILHQNYPNPFNPYTTIRYEVSLKGRVTLRVSDILGREVIRLVDTTQTPGQYSITWYGRDRSGSELSSGIYFVTLMMNEKPVKSMKLLLIK